MVADLPPGLLLDRCPFDANTVQLFTRTWPYARWWVKCECGAVSPPRSSPEDAAAWWNRRVDPEDMPYSGPILPCHWCEQQDGKHADDCPAGRAPVDTGRLRDVVTVTIDPSKCELVRDIPA